MNAALSAPKSRAVSKWQALALLAASGLVAGLAGCAQTLEEVDTVQPNYSKKSDLLGKEWYLRQTVVQTQFTGAYTFPGEMGSLVRGVFDAQEKALFFYRTYEFVEGSEAYAMKADIDTPLKDKDGKTIVHAVPQDFQKIKCSPSGEECGPGAWCADAAKPKLADEADHHGFCVQQATRYVYRGAPVLAYPILSHFDIIYDYSTATGEKTNKKLENTSDRKWYDREFIRVAWGSSQVANFDVDPLGISVYLAGGSVPVIYEGEGAPEGEGFETGTTKHLDPSGPGEHWFTYTDRQVLAAASTYLEGFGQIPLCFFYPWATGAVNDCTSEEIKIRHFYLEVPQYKNDPDRRFVARDSDDVEFEKFGYFRTERPRFDIEFGNTFSGATRRMQRHRIWDRYVKKTVDVAGAKVWKGEFDYSKMTPQPIVYYMNEDHPRELVKASKDIAAEWSEPFESVVKFHKPGYTLDHPMFVLCENNDEVAQKAVKAGQPVAEHSGTAVGKRFCRDMDKPKHFGDLRYSFMHAVPNPIQVGLYGYGPSAADPITGETIAASAHAYVGVMKSGAEAALQALELQAGIKDFNDIKRASEKVFQMEAKSLKTYDQRGPKSVAEVQEAVAGMMDADVRDRMQNVGLPLVDNGGTYAESRLARVQAKPDMDAMLSGDDDGHSLLALIKDPRVKANQSQPLKPDQLSQVSLSKWNHTAAYNKRQKTLQELGEKTLHFADFADNALVGLAEEYGRRYDEALCTGFAATTDTLFTQYFADAKTFWKDDKWDVCTEVGKFESKGAGEGRICLERDLAKTPGTATEKIKAWAPCSSRLLMHKLRLAVNTSGGGSPYAEQYHVLPGPLWSNTTDPVLARTQQVGREIVDKLRTTAKLELWERIYKGTQEHEVGHTLGLRHNFEASTDALNFHKEFWDLKVKKGTNEVLNPLQPDTLEQARGNIREKQLASVMDYTSKFNGRFADLGLYDKAAIKFGYGDIVEVFDGFGPANLEKDPDGAGNLAPMRDYLATPAKSAGKPSDEAPGTVMVQFHGNSDVLKLTRRLHYSTLPKYFGSVEGMYKRKDVAWSTLKGDRCKADADCGGKKCVALGDDSYCSDTSVVEVPYRFCSDEYNGQTPSCATFDEGVDSYEIARNAIDDYEQYWYFWGYSRDSEIFHPSNYDGRVRRQFYTAARQFQFWAIDFATYQKDGWWKARYGVDFDQDVNGGLSGGLATLNTFNTLAQVLGRPDCGFYGWNPSREKFEPYNGLDQATFADVRRVDELVGCRNLYPGWDYNGYLPRPTSGGQIYDRLAAFATLSDPTSPRFIALNETEDTRRYLVSFYNVFPRQLTNLFSGIAIEDATHYGWYVVKGPQGDEMKRRVWVGPESEVPLKFCKDFPEGQAPDGCVKYTAFPDARPIFPSSRFRLPLQASYYGMALLTKGFDRSFMDVSRVYLAGHHTQIELPKDAEVATFTDPLSGKVYVAPKVTGETLNPGYLAVLAAQKELSKWKSLSSLQENYLFSEYQFRVSLLDLVRSLHEMYEY